MSEQSEVAAADSSWWSEWGKQFGWDLHGFSRRDRATFCGGHMIRNTFTITAKHRKDLDRAITEGRASAEAIRRKLV